MSSNDAPLKPSIKSEPGAQKNYNQRRNFRKKHQNGGNNFTSHITKAKFKGGTEGMEGHIYDVEVSNQAGLFANTTNKIVSYAGQSYRESQDICIALESISEINMSLPKNECTGDDLIGNLILTR